MTSRLAPLVLALALALTGCIALPEAPASEEDDLPGTPPPSERIDGMTAEVTYVDAVEPCDDGQVRVPPGAFCATRTLDAVGRIGLDELPVDLSTLNGEIRLTPSQGDAWSFHAVVKVRGLTEEGSRQGLNTTWSWSHERDGGHALVAGPTARPPSPGELQGLGASLESASYEATLPPWLFLEVAARTTNGEITVQGFEMGSVLASTTNGAIAITGKASDLDLETTNGAVVVAMTPTASGAVRASTTNGAIELLVPEGSAHGYDAKASTTNGDIQILLQDGKVSEGSGQDFGGKRKTFRTDGYDGRPVRTTVELSTTNGEILLAGRPG